MSERLRPPLSAWCERWAPRSQVGVCTGPPREPGQRRLPGAGDPRPCPPQEPPQDRAAERGRAGGSRWGVSAPRGAPGSSLSPRPAGPRPCCGFRLFIYNLYSACFQESSEALAEKLLPQAGLCSHQPWAPSPRTLSLWLPSSDVSAWRPGRTRSGPRDRPSLPGQLTAFSCVGGHTCPPGRPPEPRGRGPGNVCTPLLPSAVCPVATVAPPGCSTCPLARPRPALEGTRTPQGALRLARCPGRVSCTASWGRHAGREGPAG